MFSLSRCSVSYSLGILLLSVGLIVGLSTRPLIGPEKNISVPNTGRLSPSPKEYQKEYGMSGTIGSFYAVYPNDGAVGLPPRAYILNKCVISEDLLNQLKSTIQALSDFSRPLYDDLVKDKAAETWVKKASALHQKIFLELNKHPEIIKLNIMIGDKWQSPEDKAKEPSGCWISYFNYPCRTLGIFSGNKGNGSISGIVPEINPSDREAYRLYLTSINGSKGGWMYLALRLPLKYTPGVHVFGKGTAVFKYSFNPFAKYPEKDWASGLEVVMKLSKDFHEVEITKYGSSRNRVGKKSL